MLQMVDNMEPERWLEPSDVCTLEITLAHNVSVDEDLRNAIELAHIVSEVE